MREAINKARSLSTKSSVEECVLEQVLNKMVTLRHEELRASVLI